MAQRVEVYVNALRGDGGRFVMAAHDDDILDMGVAVFNGTQGAVDEALVGHQHGRLGAAEDV